MAKRYLGLRTCIYKVDDIDKAAEWYSKAFETQPYFSEPFYVGFNIAGYELGLIPDKEEADKKPANVRTYWGVEDVEAEYQRLIDMGATPHEEPDDVGDSIMVAAVRDPWGNVLGIIYNPHFTLS